MNHRQLFRKLAAATAVIAALSCVDSDDRRAEAALLTADSEEGGVQGLLSLNYEITSDVFKKWKQAQLSLDRALGRAQARALKAAIISTRPTREAIERGVARIEANSRARRAIEDAGMTPRTYVVATVALFQATRGIDPITGEAFRGVPPRNVEFAQQNRAEIEAGEITVDFQYIADSIAAARAARTGAQIIQVDTIDVGADTGSREPTPRPLPQPVPAPPPPPTPTPPQPTPPPPTTPSRDQPAYP